ncbi:hypothetical protein J3F83DRAFT_723932 [Trichoderma novae-zelandiae]
MRSSACFILVVTGFVCFLLHSSRGHFLSNQRASAVCRFPDGRNAGVLCCHFLPPLLADGLAESGRLQGSSNSSRCVVGLVWDGEPLHGSCSPSTGVRWVLPSPKGNCFFHLRHVLDTFARGPAAEALIICLLVVSLASPPWAFPYLRGSSNPWEAGRQLEMVSDGPVRLRTLIGGFWTTMALERDRDTTERGIESFILS